MTPVSRSAGRCFHGFGWQFLVSLSAARENAADHNTAHCSELLFRQETDDAFQLVQEVRRTGSGRNPTAGPMTYSTPPETRPRALFPSSSSSSPTSSFDFPSCFLSHSPSTANLLTHRQFYFSPSARSDHEEQSTQTHCFRKIRFTLLARFKA